MEPLGTFKIQGNKHSYKNALKITVAPNFLSIPGRRRNKKPEPERPSKDFTMMK